MTSPFGIPPQGSASELVKFLSEFATELETAAERVDPNHLPLSNVLDGSMDWKGGRPYNNVAIEVGAVSADAYFEIYGIEPVRIVDEEGSYGAFTDFLTQVFQVLEIEASADVVAKAIITRRHMAKTIPD